MLAEPEQYKGISFVRISSLPGWQKSILSEKTHRERVIKIIKDNALLNDCIIYDDYVEWYNQFVEILERNEMLDAVRQNSNSFNLLKNQS
jgi:hypothetical protein